MNLVKRKVSKKDVDWANVIFTTEKEHLVRTQAKYCPSPSIIVLEIPDEYDYMDESLIAHLREAVKPF